MLLRSRSCALPDPARPRVRHFYPLIGFVVPTVIIGYGLVIPRNGIAGINELTLGFASSVIGACVTYAVGIRSALRSCQPTGACQRRRGWRRPMFLARQAALPAGGLGWILAHIMALETAAANDITIELTDLAGQEHVLEVGCGHGRAVARIAEALPQGRVVGLDPSATMVRLATKRNREWIRRGRARIDVGVAERLPYADASFDRVVATHTVYFWRELEPVLRALRRVLKPGGRLVLGFGEAETMRRQFPESVYTLRSPDETCQALRRAGFEHVTIETRTMPHAMHWIIAS